MNRYRLNTLQSKIFFALIIILIAFAVLSISLMLSSSRNHEKEVSQRMHRDLAQHIVDHYLFYNNGKPDYDVAKQTFHDLMILGPNFEFYLLDKHGNIVAHDADDHFVKQQTVNLQPLQQFITQREISSFITGSDPKNPDQNKIFSAAPIIQMGDTYGYLYIVIGSAIRDQIDANLGNSHILLSSVWVLCLGITLALFSVWLAVKLITKPLSNLAQQVQGVQTVGFDGDEAHYNQALNALKYWQADSHNDIHILGYAFRQALETLKNQYQDVVTIDDLRKELLAHVSHDLRTPLASLLGYLETWELQQDSISKEQSEKYIHTAKKNANLIANLIEQLFELAHLDSNNVSIRLEPFPIAELAHDVLQKFSIAAKHKQISMQVYPQDTSILVRADLEKMERILSNLIENALRHTPEGGSITINLKQSLGFVAIEVSDTGIGIPEQDIHHIFEPHFKAGNSVRENTAHGGLGLAITKKLLDLHQSVINVKSQLNEGTTFQFNLPSVE